MFDFAEAGQRKRVEAILAAQISENCLQELYGGQSRSKERSPHIQVVCMVQETETGWDFDSATPVVSRDISLTGLSILNRTPVSGQILLEAPTGTGSRFVRCNVQHCRDIGHGYFHIGLSAKEVVPVEAIDRNRIERKLSEFSTQVSTPENVMAT